MVVALAGCDQVRQPPRRIGILDAILRLEQQARPAIAVVGGERAVPLRKSGKLPEWVFVSQHHCCNT